METSCFLQCSLLPSSLFSPTVPTHLPRLGFYPLKSSKSKAFAIRRESWDHSGQLVDQSLIILRKRIHEMKMIEQNYEPPAEWAAWEQQHYAAYYEFICKVVGMLQLQLMNTRPSLALGMISLVIMSIPASAFMIVSHLMEAATNSFLPTIHL